MQDPRAFGLKLGAPSCRPRLSLVDELGLVDAEDSKDADPVEVIGKPRLFCKTYIFVEPKWGPASRRCYVKVSFMLEVVDEPGHEDEPS